MENFDIYLGTFNNNKFSWKKIKSIKNVDEAEKEFVAMARSLLAKDQEELIKEYKTTRLDLELREKEKILSWVGIYLKEQ